MIRKWKQPFLIFKKRCPVCITLGNCKQRKSSILRISHASFGNIGLDVLMDKVKWVAGIEIRMKISARICAAIAGITAIDERNVANVF